MACMPELAVHWSATPIGSSVNWLRVWWRIQFELCTIMHTLHSGKCSAYKGDYQSNRHELNLFWAGSVIMSYCVTKWLRAKFSEWTFSFTALAAWNIFPDSAVFQKKIKCACLAQRILNFQLYS